MMKKALLSILALAPTCCLAWSWSCGPYVGAGLGIDTADFRETAQISQSPRNFDVTNKTQLAAQGALGDIFAGYGIHNSLFYVAAELNFSASTAKSHISNVEAVHGTSAATTIRINHNWGIGILPGVLLPQNTILYGRLGYVRGRLHVHTSDVSLASTHCSRAGARIGVGLEKYICRNFSLRAEYSHIGYRHRTGRTFDANSAVTKTATLYPDTNQFELGLSYWFC